MTEPPRLHPSARSQLPSVSVVTALAGAYFLSHDENVWGLVFFGWSLTAFVLHTLAWLMREHQLWRDERGQEQG